MRADKTLAKHNQMFPGTIFETESDEGSSRACSVKILAKSVHPGKSYAGLKFLANKMHIGKTLIAHNMMFHCRT